MTFSPGDIMWNYKDSGQIWVIKKMESLKNFTGYSTIAFYLDDNLDLLADDTLITSSFRRRSSV